MYSWGPDCKLVAGAYGGITYDTKTKQFIHACESWTPDRLPYSCTPLRLVPMPFRLEEPKKLESTIEQQVDFYRERQKPNRNSHIPEDLLKAVIMKDRIAIQNDPLPQHNRLHLSTCQNYQHDRIIILSHLEGKEKLKMTRIYEPPEPYNHSDELLVDHYIGRTVKMVGSVTKVVNAQRAPVMANLTSTSEMLLWNMKECVQLCKPVKIPNEEAFDVDLSAFGNHALVGTKSGCRMFDIYRETLKQHWRIDTSLGIKHCAVMCEYTNVAASVNKMIVLDNRSDRHSTLPFDIGGAPMALATGNTTNSLLYLSGPERLLAVDLRKPKCPILQWQQRESFGGCLGMLRFVPTTIGEHQGDVMTAVNLDTHELVMVPIQANAGLNTITVLSSAIQSNLNVNRAYIRLKERKAIIGHDWLKLHDNQFLSVHQTSDGQLAYQMHSFSDTYQNQPTDQAHLLTQDPIPKPHSIRVHQRLSHGELFSDCVTSKRTFVQVGPEQQEVLAGWNVPVRSLQYIPRLLAKALSLRGEGVGGECDPSLLSSAARILYKQWH